MSINIPKAVVDVADSITVIVNTGKLGPRQQKALARFVRTGIITGASVPGYLAKAILLEHGAPFFAVGRYHRVEWGNVAPDEEHFWRQLNVVLATKEINAYAASYLKELRAAIVRRAPQHKQWIGRRIEFSPIMKRTKFVYKVPADYKVPRTFTYDALKGETL